MNRNVLLSLLLIVSISASSLTARGWLAISIVVAEANAELEVASEQSGDKLPSQRDTLGLLCVEAFRPADSRMAAIDFFCTDVAGPFSADHLSRGPPLPSVR